MARKDDRPTGEGKQFFGDSREEEVPVPPGQIPSADPACEEDIATEKEPCPRVVDAEASGAMAGHLENIEGSSQKELSWSLEELQVGSDRFDFQIDPVAPEEIFVGHHLLGDMVHRHGTSMLPRHGCSIPDMIIMTVGQQQQGDRRLAESLGRSLWRIDQDVSLRTGNEVGVGCQSTPCEHFRGLVCQILIHFMMFAFPPPLCNGSIS